MGMDGARRETGQVPSGSPLRRRFPHCWRVSQRYAAQKQRSGSVCQGGCSDVAGPTGMRPGAVCRWGAASPGSLPPESPFSGVPRKTGRPSINAADWKRNRPGLGPVLSLADAGQAGGKPPVSSGCAGLPLRAAAGCAVQSTLFLIWVRAKETKPCSALLNTVSLR